MKIDKTKTTGLILAANLLALGAAPAARAQNARAGAGATELGVSAAASAAGGASRMTSLPGGAMTMPLSQSSFFSAAHSAPNLDLSGAALPAASPALTALPAASLPVAPGKSAKKSPGVEPNSPWPHGDEPGRPVAKARTPREFAAGQNAEGADPVQGVALSQLKEELEALKDEKALIETLLQAAYYRQAYMHANQPYQPKVIADLDRVLQQARDLKIKIADKQAQIRDEKSVLFAAYGRLRRELSVLKTERRDASAVVPAMDQIGHEYNGGGEQARARQEEKVGSLSAAIDAKNTEIARLRSDASVWLPISHFADSAWKNVRRFFGFVGTENGVNILSGGHARDASAARHDPESGSASPRALGLMTALGALSAGIGLLAHGNSTALAAGLMIAGSMGAVLSITAGGARSDGEGGIALIMLGVIGGILTSAAAIAAVIFHFLFGIGWAGSFGLSTAAVALTAAVFVRQRMARSRTSQR